jgi:hypothetical protein
VRTGLILIGLLHLGGVSLSAQQRSAPFTRWEPSAAAAESTSSRRAAEVKWGALGDYRYEGLALGGLVLGAFGVWAGSQISAGCPLEPGVSCHTDRAWQAVALGLAGAAIGGGIGYLVGRFDTRFPSADLVSVPDSVRIRTGYQHWRGGALGLAVGGALGALTGAIAGFGQCDDCTEQPSRGEAALTLGFIGAGTGGLLGFLVGLTSPRYAWIPSGAQ